MSEPEKNPDAPATKADLASEKWSVNFTTLVSTGTQFFLLVAVIMGGGWVIVDRAFAAGKDGAHLIVDPITPRVSFLEAQVPFIVAEQREQRTEFRAFVDKGAKAPELTRPMAPLPLAPDAGQ